MARGCLDQKKNITRREETKGEGMSICRKTNFNKTFERGGMFKSPFRLAAFDAEAAAAADSCVSSHIFFLCGNTGQLYIPQHTASCLNEPEKTFLHGPTPE